MRHAAGALVLALFLLVPAALAGNAKNPEITDGRDLKDPKLDLTAAWFERDLDGVRFTVQVVAMRGKAPDHFYFVEFTFAGAEWLAGAGFDDHGNPHGYLGGVQAGRDGEPLERFANHRLRDIAVQLGSPATVSALIPWGAMTGFARGSVLEDLAAGTSLYRRADRLWQGGVDLQRTDATFVAGHPYAPTVPWLLGGLVALAGAAVVVHRARRARSDVAEEPSRNPPEEGRRAVGDAPPAPPGSRFRLDPRR